MSSASDREKHADEAIRLVTANVDALLRTSPTARSVLGAGGASTQKPVCQNVCAGPRLVQNTSVSLCTNSSVTSTSADDTMSDDCLRHSKTSTAFGTATSKSSTACVSEQFVQESRFHCDFVTGSGQSSMLSSTPGSSGLKLTQSVVTNDVDIKSGGNDSAADDVQSDITHTLPSTEIGQPPCKTLPATEVSEQPKLPEKNILLNESDAGSGGCSQTAAANNSTERSRHLLSSGEGNSEEMGSKTDEQPPESAVAEMELEPVPIADKVTTTIHTLPSPPLSQSQETAVNSELLEKNLQFNKSCLSLTSTADDSTELSQRPICISSGKTDGTETSSSDELKKTAAAVTSVRDVENDRLLESADTTMDSEPAQSTAVLRNDTRNTASRKPSRIVSFTTEDFDLFQSTYVAVYYLAVSFLDSCVTSDLVFVVLTMKCYLLFVHQSCQGADGINKHRLLPYTIHDHCTIMQSFWFLFPIRSKLTFDIISHNAVNAVVISICFLLYYFFQRCCQHGSHVCSLVHGRHGSTLVNGVLQPVA